MPKPNKRRIANLRSRLKRGERTIDLGIWSFRDLDEKINALRNKIREHNQAIQQERKDLESDIRWQRMDVAQKERRHQKKIREGHREIAELKPIKDYLGDVPLAEKAETLEAERMTKTIDYDERRSRVYSIKVVRYDPVFRALNRVARDVNAYDNGGWRKPDVDYQERMKSIKKRLEKYGYDGPRLFELCERMIDRRTRLDEYLKFAKILGVPINEEQLKKMHPSYKKSWET